VCTCDAMTMTPRAFVENEGHRSPSVGERPAAALEQVFASHQRLLWGLCYRMTGCAADADDLVQETFVRAMERPPARTEEPWRPWLVRVAINLGRDHLRRRKRRAYVGPWLPAPIETGNEESPPAYEPFIDGQQTTEGRYDLLESVSYAFLLALEALTPQQRAVLLLRDVFDYSVRETAQALDLTEPNVKTTHHRARRTMRDYDRQRCVPTRALQERAREALGRFVSALASQDVSAVEALLSESVRALSDGGGEYFAARVPLIGPARVAKFHLKISSYRLASAHFEMRMVNGLPALVGEFHDGHRGQPPRMVMRCEIDSEGRITAVHSILASRKLTAVRFPVSAAQ
jgi:RNA polymerase sigma factor (sigma-70 family)